MKLGKHINDLLFRYDCVIVPDFGGFVGNYRPARIHPEQHRFYPPGKGITFNKHLRNNDGLLASLIAQRKGCSFEEAMKSLRKEVRKMESKLKDGESVELDFIGSFRLDRDNNLLFQPLSASNFLLESYGLTSFQALPVLKNAPKQETTTTEPKVIPISGRKKANQFIKIAAAAAVLFALVWIPLKTDLAQQAGLNKLTKGWFNREAPHYVSKAGFSITKEREEDRLSLKEALETSDSELIWSFLSPMERAAETPPAIKIYNEKPQPEVTQAFMEDYQAFQVVGGCFAVQENAVKFVSKLQRRGYSAAITGKRNGLFVVAYGSFETRDEAIDLLYKIRNSENKQAWLLKK